MDGYYRNSLEDFYAGTFTPEYLNQLKTLAQQLYGREQFNGMLIANVNVAGFRHSIAQRLAGGGGSNNYLVNNNYLNQPIMIAGRGGLSGLFTTQEQKPNSAWLSVAQSWVKQDDSSKTYGYRYKPYAFTVGYDRQISDHWQLGAAFQYDAGTAKSNNHNRVEVKSKDYLFGLYGEYHIDNWYIDGGIQYGMVNNDSTSKFDVMGQPATSQGSFDIDLWGGNVEAGMMINRGGWHFTPYIGLNYAHYRQDGFSETGDYNFIRHFNATTYDVIEVPVGFRLKKAIPLGHQSYLVPSVDFSYAASVGDNEISTTAHFVGVPGIPFRVNGAENGKNIVRGAFGLNAQINHAWDIAGRYSMNWRKNYTGQQFDVQLRYKF